MADAATDSFDRDLVLGLVSFEQEGLYEIDAALKRIRGRYVRHLRINRQADPLGATGSNPVDALFKQI